MKISHMKLASFVLLTFLAATFALAADQQKAPKVVQVETKKVCMVNDKLFDKDQIPVEVQGKTYYGCCDMCKQALKERAEMRVAIDPVSGKEVDKAIAIIGATSDGVTYYFQSVDNLNAFNKKN